MTSSRPKRAITPNPKYAESSISGDEQEASLTSTCLTSNCERRAKKTCGKAPEQNGRLQFRKAPEQNRRLQFRKAPEQNERLRIRKAPQQNRRLQFRKAPGMPPTEPLNGVDRWGRCVTCQSLVELRNEDGARCGCGGVVRFDANSWYDNWVQCSSCAQWRAISKATMQEIEEQGEGLAWHCSMMFAGATCRTPARSWSSAVRAMDKQARVAKAGMNGTQLSVADEAVAPAPCDPVRESWCVHASEQLLGFEEYVVGRDRLVPPEALAAGLDVSDGQTGDHVLWTTQLPPASLSQLRPFVDAFLLLWQHGLLTVHEDGRVSAGPVDVRKYLAQPAVKAQVDLAVSARQKRLKMVGMAGPRPCELLKYIVHVSPDGRKVYIGEESDKTSRGNSVMDFNKSWKSNPIPSWSGGWKRADMPGATPNQVVQSELSALLGAEEHHLVEAAEQLWQLLAAHPETGAAAARMLRAAEAGRRQGAPFLGGTGWNAYSLNLDFRTAVHIDGKNTNGSYSALVVLHSGPPWAGGFYMLPQYHVALDLRQGVVLFHRSGEKHVGLHGNSALWNATPASHRISLVIYQTRLWEDM